MSTAIGRLVVLAGVLFGAWSCTAIVGVGDYKSGGGDAAASDTDDATADDSSTDDSGQVTPDTGTGDTGGHDSATGADSSGCATALCNGACCGSGEICIKTSNAIDACAQSCASGYVQTAVCGGSTPCCHTLTNDTDGGSTWNGKAACVATPSPNEGVCLCTTSTECAGESCAPSAANAPDGGTFSVCEPNDGTFLHGCNANCGSCQDCVIDCHGNHYCAGIFSTTCTGGTCPANWCVATPSGCDNDIESCGSDCMLCACE